MLGNIQMGDMSGMIGAAITIAVAGIVLLTVAPGIVSDIDQIYLNGQRACVVGDERFTRISGGESFSTGGSPTTPSRDAEESWAQTTAFTALTIPTTGTGPCVLAANAASGSSTSYRYFTPGGVPLTVVAGANAIAPATTSAPAFQSLTALGGGSLVTLLFGAMAIMLPVGAIAFLGFMGGQLVQQNVGEGGGMAVAIAAAVGTAVVAAILPSVFSPLDDFYRALDGVRYAVYSTGIGRLGGVLGDFLAVALIAGIIVLGALLWRGQQNDGGMKGSARGSGGNMSF